MSTHARTTARRRPLIALMLAAASLVGMALVAPTAPVGAAFPGVNGRIAWATAPIDSGANLRIVTANPDGTMIDELTDGTYSDSGPSFSPDSTKILFTRKLDPGLVESIWVMNADGSNQTALVEDPSLNREATWSPDGSKILFNSNRNGSYEVFVADADGSNPTALVEGSHPAWVPNGSKISYISAYGIDIWTMNPDGSDPTQLTEENGSTSPYDWAPDSSKVMYRCSDPGDFNTHCTIDADGTNRTAIGGPGVDEFGGVFSPDGGQILFYGYPDATPDTNVLYVANADGSDPVAVGTDSIYYINSTWGSSPQQVEPTTTTTSTSSSSSTTSTTSTSPRAVPQATPRYTG